MLLLASWYQGSVICVASRCVILTMEAAPQLLSKLQRILVPWSVGFSIQDGAVSVVHVALSGLITERTGLFYLAIEILKGEMVSWLSVLGTCYLAPLLLPNVNRCILYHC